MDTDRIVVMRTITYDLAKVVESWKEDNNGTEPTDDEIMELIEKWVEDDLRTPPHRSEMLWTDADGNEV